MPRTPHADAHPDVHVVTFYVEETVCGRDGDPEVVQVPLALEVLASKGGRTTIIGAGYGGRLRLTEWQTEQLLEPDAHERIKSVLCP